MASLILPQSIRSRKRRPAPYLGVVRGHRELTGQPSSSADLIAELTQWRRSDVIRILIWLLQRCSSLDVMNPEKQLSLARQLLDHELFEAARKTWQSEADPCPILFSRWQVWFVLQFAIVACREDDALAPESENDPKLAKSVAKCCVIASDFFRLHHEPFDGNEEDDAEFEKRLFNELISLGDFRWSSGQPELLRRAESLWFKIATKPHVQKRAQQIGLQGSFDEVFQAAFGVSLRTFVDVIVSTWAWFGMQQDEQRRPWRFDPAVCYPPAGEHTEAVYRALRLVAKTPDALAEELIFSSRQGWGRDYTVLKQAPLIELDRHAIVCPDLSLLYDVIVDQVYWRLYDAYGPRSTQFRELFGDVFEEYVRDRLRDVFPQSAVLYKSHLRSPIFVGTESQVCDDLIRSEKAVIMFETKAKMLTNHQRYSGDVDALFKAVDQLAVKTSGHAQGVGQLAKSICRLHDGQIAVSEGVEFGLQDRSIYPVLVTYDSAFGGHIVRKRLDRKLRKFLEEEGWSIECTERIVRPLTVLSIDQLESLAIACEKRSMESILVDYSAHLSSPTGEKDILGSMSTFLYNRYPDVNRIGKTQVRADYERILKEIQERVLSMAGSDA